MLGDDGFERASLSQCGGVFGAQDIEIFLGIRLVEFLRLDRAAKLADLFCDAAGALGNALEFKCQLAALSAE